MISFDILSLIEKSLNNERVNIALTNMGHVTLQQKTIIVILSYLSQSSKHQGKKTGLITFHSSTGLYQNHFRGPHKKDQLISICYLGHDIINWSVLLGLSLEERKDFLDRYSFIFWDLPDMNFINSNIEYLKSFFKLFNRLFIVSSKPTGLSNREFISVIHNFYNSHGLKLPQLISFSERTSEIQN